MNSPINLKDSLFLSLTFCLHQSFSVYLLSYSHRFWFCSFLSECWDGTMLICLNVTLWGRVERRPCCLSRAQGVNESLAALLCADGWIIELCLPKREVCSYRLGRNGDGTRRTTARPENCLGAHDWIHSDTNTNDVIKACCAFPWTEIFQKGYISASGTISVYL